jgi:glutamine transport system permease protein
MSELLSWLQIMVGGLWVTIQLSAATALGCIVLSTGLAIFGISRRRFLRAFVSGYVDIFRSIPLLVLLLLVYYGLGSLTKETGLNTFWLVAISLIVSESAYLSQTYRGGIQAIPAGQWDAGGSIGLTWGQTLRLIILPQAIPPGIPSTLNSVIGIVKNSSLASLVGLAEVTLVSNDVVYSSFRPLQVYLVLGVLYAAVVIPLTILSAWYERRINRALPSQKAAAALTEATAAAVGAR